MKKITARFFLISLLLFTTFFYSGSSVSAQSVDDSTFLTISPPIRELELPPGSNTSYQVSILNQGSKTLRLILRASPFVAAGEAGGVNVSDNELSNTQDWVIINPSILTLAPNERREITYTITLPRSAEPGGFYFAITALISGKVDLTPGSVAETKTGAAVNLNVSSLNIVRISGPALYASRISEFSTSNKIFEYGPVPFVVRILNSGNVHFKPILEINIHNTFNSKEKSTIYLKQQNILPGTQRKYEEAEFGGKWHFGRYAATLTGLYGTGQSLSYTIFFWIIPWKMIIAVVLAVTIIGILGYLMGKKRVQTETGEIPTV